MIAPPAVPPPDTPPDESGPPSRGLRLSFSKVDEYLTCPLKYRFSRVDRLPRKPAPHLSWGTSVHSALEAWWSSAPSGDGSAPTVEDLLAAYFRGWDDTGFVGVPRDEKVAWYRWGQDILRRHHARHAAGWVPAVAVESRFTLDLGDDVAVVGYVDHVERTGSGGVAVVDWKTSRKPKTRSQVRGSLQLAVYALACRELFGEDPEWVALDFVVGGLRVKVPFCEIDVDGARGTVLSVASEIRAGRFDPTPSPLCGWCDHQAVCPLWQGDEPVGKALVELARLRRRLPVLERRIGSLEAAAGGSLPTV